MENNEAKCGCPCHMMMGIFVILFGLTFLLGALGVLSHNIVDIIWPSLIILAGLKKTMAAKGMCKCCSSKA